MTATTKKGFTPLHLASKYGRTKIATLLLHRGAPVDAQGKASISFFLFSSFFFFALINQSNECLNALNHHSSARRDFNHMYFCAEWCYTFTRG